MEDFSSQDTRELAKALINVQRDMSPATKDATNPFCKNKYATLNSVMEACRPALLKHGIWLTQLPLPAPLESAHDHIALLTKLTHAETGQWQSSMTVVPLPKADPQGMGSAITYARRYALTAMLGIVTEDDDGEAAKIPTLNGSNTDTHARRPLTSPRTQREASDEAQFRKTERQPENRNLESLQNLPRLEGVAYKFVATDDGRECVIATGNTLSMKGALKNAGFQWDGQQRVWWKYADVA